MDHGAQAGRTREDAIAYDLGNRSLEVVQESRHNIVTDNLTCVRSTDISSSLSYSGSYCL